jgi:hypothetical protein
MDGLSFKFNNLTNGQDIRKKKKHCTINYLTFIRPGKQRNAGSNYITHRLPHGLLWLLIAFCLLLVWFMFDPEDGGSIFLRNIFKLPPKYTA